MRGDDACCFEVASEAWGGGVDGLSVILLDCKSMECGGVAQLEREMSVEQKLCDCVSCIFYLGQIR